MAYRYRAVLEVLRGSSIGTVAAQYGTSRQSVHAWRRRFVVCGLGTFLTDRSQEVLHTDQLDTALARVDQGGRPPAQGSDLGPAADRQPALVAAAEFYPAALIAFPNLTHAAALTVLRAAPSSQHAKKLTPSRIVALLRRAGRRNDPGPAERLAAQLRGESMRQPSEAEQAQSREMGDIRHRCVLTQDRQLTDGHQRANLARDALEVTVQMRKIGLGLLARYSDQRCANTPRSATAAAASITRSVGSVADSTQALAQALSSTSKTELVDRFAGTSAQRPSALHLLGRLVQP